MTDDKGDGYGDCAWCGKPGTTMLYVQGGPKSKHPKLVPVCDHHERHFTAKGAETLRSVERERREGLERRRAAFRRLKRR